MRKFFAVLLAGLALLLIVTGVFAQDDTIKIAIGVEPDVLDPVRQSTVLIANIVDFTCETLLYMTPDSELEPLLATSWSVSPSGLEYTFNIRQGVKFHDSTPLNAEAVKFSFDRIIDPNIPTPWSGYVGPLERVEVVDEYIVRVILSKPFAPFLTGAAYTATAIVSPTAVRDMSPEEFIFSPVGTGPFKIESYVPGVRVVQVRNEDYWGDLALPKKIIWNIVPEAGTRLAQVLSGDIDIAYQISPADIPRVEANPSVELVSVPSTRTMGLCFNTSKPPYDDKKVRQALAHAIDADAIAEDIMRGAASRSTGLLAPSFFGYYELPPYEYNPELSKQLLAEAGYPDGIDDIAMFFHTAGRTPMDTEVCQAIQAYLGEVGVDVALVTMDWSAFIAALLSPRDKSPYHLTNLSWGTPPDAHHTLYTLFHSSMHPPKSFNLSFYSNAEVDRLLEEAAVEVDRNVRRDLYRQASVILWEDVPWDTLYVVNMSLAVNADLRDLIVYPWEKFSVVKSYLEK